VVALRRFSTPAHFSDSCRERFPMNPMNPMNSIRLLAALVSAASGFTGISPLISDRHHRFSNLPVPFVIDGRPALPYSLIFNTVYNDSSHTVLKNVDSLLFSEFEAPHTASAEYGRVILIASPEQLLAKSPIPEDWLTKHHQSTTDMNIASADPDGDGFTNEEEWIANTDPEEKTSHPPYHTKLLLEYWRRTRLPVTFLASDGDPSKPETMSFQVNVAHSKLPSRFIKFGDNVPDTTYKIIHYTFKENDEPGVNEKIDASELTLVDKNTGKQITLVKQAPAYTNDSSAMFRYTWHLPGQVKLPPFTVAKGETFVLPPDPATSANKYKLLDVNENAALVQTPQGERVLIPHDPNQPMKTLDLPPTPPGGRKP
jgi:hypothetical protein